MATANHVQNRSLTKLIVNKTPYEVLYNKKPNLNYLRVFGCKVIAHIEKHKRSKFEPKGKVYRFIGYSSSSKGYRLLDPSDSKVIVRRDVKFLEDDFNFKLENSEEKSNYSEKKSDSSEKCTININLDKNTENGNLTFDEDV